MRKRILGAAVLFSFIVSLTAASNMKEDVKIKEVPAMEGLAAGSIRFAHSFTPESDEKTGIEKKESMIVTSAYDDDLMQEKIRTTKETQMEETAQAVQETPAEQNAQTVQEAPASRMHKSCRRLRRHRPHRKTAGISLYRRMKQSCLPGSSG